MRFPKQPSRGHSTTFGISSSQELVLKTVIVDYHSLQDLRHTLPDPQLRNHAHFLHSALASEHHFAVSTKVSLYRSPQPDMCVEIEPSALDR